MSVRSGVHSPPSASLPPACPCPLAPSSSRPASRPHDSAELYPGFAHWEGAGASQNAGSPSSWLATGGHEVGGIAAEIGVVSCDSQGTRRHRSRPLLSRTHSSGTSPRLLPGAPTPIVTTTDSHANRYSHTSVVQSSILRCAEDYVHIYSLDDPEIPSSAGRHHRTRLYSIGKEARRLGKLTTSSHVATTITEGPED